VLLADTSVTIAVLGVDGLEAIGPLPLTGVLVWVGDPTDVGTDMGPEVGVGRVVGAATGAAVGVVTTAGGLTTANGEEPEASCLMPPVTCQPGLVFVENSCWSELLVLGKGRAKY
jgi:hypothetical protein